jgi:hypothetical protein
MPAGVTPTATQYTRRGGAGALQVFGMAVLLSLAHRGETAARAVADAGAAAVTQVRCAARLVSSSSVRAR